MRARVPASAANLGPGFDTLAVALALYLTVEVEPADSLTVRATGFGAGTPVTDHLGVVVARDVLGHDHFALTVHSEIPVRRGLGSSAALAVAAAAAAGAADPLSVGAAYDGHPENAAASWAGGLVAAARSGDDVVVTPCALDPALRFVVVVPGVEVATERARAALPDQVPLADAAFNLSRLAWLLDGLAHHERLSADATADRLHQPYRDAVFPFAGALLAGLCDAGALAACWCGSGSSMLGFTTAADISRLVVSARQVLTSCGVVGDVLALEADRTGLVVG